MRNIQKQTLLCFLSFFLLMLSCTKKENIEVTAPKISHPEEVLNYIKSMGYPESSILDAGAEYIVEGDIAFPKDMTLPEDTGRVATEEQYYSGNLVSKSRQSNIKIRIDPALAAVQNAEFNAAVTLWNNSGSNIHFIIVTTGEDILVKNTDLMAGTCGQAPLPINGLPGNLIDIDVAEVNGQNFNQRMINIAHEIGHTIGFKHTNGVGTGVFIDVPGWAGADANSIMNGNMCGVLPTVLSAKDIGAVKALYPFPTPQNVRIDITSSQFIIRWDPVVSNDFIGYTVDYSGFSGVNFGNSVSLSSIVTSSYTVPGVTPYPTSGQTQTGGIQATVKAKYTGGIIMAAPTVSRNKVNGVWQ